MSDPESGDGRLRQALRGAAGAAYFLAVTGVLVFARLPVDRVLEAAARAVEQRGGPQLAFGPAALSWSGVLRIDQVTAKVRLGDNVAPAELGHVRVAPSWWGLLLGNPGVRLDAEAYGGQIRPAQRPRAGGWSG